MGDTVVDFDVVGLAVLLEFVGVAVAEGSVVGVGVFVGVGVGVGVGFGAGRLSGSQETTVRAAVVAAS